MKFNHVEYLLDEYLNTLTNIKDTKQKANLKYRIKTGYDKEKQSKVVVDFKNFIKEQKTSIDSEMSDMAEAIKVKDMSEEEKLAYDYQKNKKRQRILEDKIRVCKKKIEKYIKKNNISSETIFKKYFKYDKDCVKAADTIVKNELDFETSCESARLDGRMTHTLNYMITEYDDFDEAFNNMYQKLNTEWNLNCDYIHFIEAMCYYYDFERKEFDLTVKNWRKKEIENMPVRGAGELYMSWIKRMGDAGFYCGYPHKNYGNPVDYKDAWVFVGKKILKHLRETKQECIDTWGLRISPDGTKNRYVIPFVEIIFLLPEDKENTSGKLKIIFQPHTHYSIHYQSVNEMKKKFDRDFIAKRLHTKLSIYGQ